MQNDGENDPQSLGLREIGFLYLNPFSEAHKKVVVVHLTKRKVNACVGKELVRGDRQDL